MKSKYLCLAFMLSIIRLKVAVVGTIDSKLNKDCCWAKFLCEEEDILTSWRCSQEGYVCCSKYLIHPPPMEITDITCGKRFENGFGFRIEGENDYNADVSEFPWMISIYNEGQFQCAGSLIEEGVVLTAAHCVRDNHTRYQARILELNPSTSSDVLDYQVSKVHQIIRHPNFSRISLKNDIALLILEKPGFNLSTYDVNNTRICYDNSNDHMKIDKNDCWITGWGAKQRNKPKTLSKVQIPLISQDNCLESLRETKLGRQFNLPENVFCAGGVAGKDPTIGDGGGPLFCKILNTEDNYKQIGIISYRVSHRTTVPNVYTNVSKYLQWIGNEIKH